MGWGQPGQRLHRPKETRCFHLLPKLHDRRGGVLQGHMAVVGHVQFLELHAVLCSRKQDKKHKKITLCKGWSLDNIQSRWCNQVVFTQPLQVNMPQRALRGKSITYSLTGRLGLIPTREDVLGVGHLLPLFPTSTPCPILSS